MSTDHHDPESLTLRHDRGEAAAAAAAEAPVLEARSIPKEIRHGAVFGAFESLAPGRSLIVVEPHDPTPLLNQLRERFPTAGIEYVEAGPIQWRVRLIRR